MLCHSMKGVRCIPIVGVNPGDNITASLREAPIKRMRLSAVGLRAPTQMWILLQDRDRIIGGAPIDNDMLKVRIVLLQNRFDRLADKLPMIIRNSNDREFW